MGSTTRRRSMLTRLALVAALTLVASAAVSSTSSGGNVVHGARMAAPNHKISQSTSSNWAGYSAFNGRYTTVSASWKQPTASCTSQTTYSSFWVGLDGYNSSTVEQTGTSADCNGGSARYYAWYEMYPKFPVNLSIAVRPGDSMSGSVTTDGAGHFTLHIHNGTTGGDFVTTQTSKKARLSSAAAIAEAPSGSGGVLPLTNFGTASFSAVTVNGQAIGSFNPGKIDMVGDGFRSGE